jgi:hypothetical protein
LGQYRDSFFTVIPKRSLLIFSPFHFELTFHKGMLEWRRRRGRRRKQRQPPGPLRVSPGLYRDSCTLPFLTLTLDGVGQLHAPPALTLGQITQYPLSKSTLSYVLTQYFCKLTSLHVSTRSRDSVVGIATRYELEGPGIESRWGEIFRTYPDRLRGPPSLLYNGYRVFSGGKGGRGVMLTTHPLIVPRLRKS